MSQPQQQSPNQPLQYACDEHDYQGWTACPKCKPTHPQQQQVVVSEMARKAALKAVEGNNSDPETMQQIEIVAVYIQDAINTALAEKVAEIEEWRKVLSEVKSERDASQVDCINLRTELAEAKQVIEAVRLATQPRRI